jgi:cytochrome c oxidase assembly factor CtaG
VGDDLELVAGQDADRLGLQLTADLDVQADAFRGQRLADLAHPVGQGRDVDLLGVRGGDDGCGPRRDGRAGVRQRLVERPRAVVDARQQVAVQIDGGHPTQASLGRVTPLGHVAASFEPLQLIAPVLAGVLYARRASTLARQGRPVALWRQLCFAAGLLLGVAGLTALGHLGGERFVAHMAEHLLLGDLAALLIVLGLSGPVLAPVLRVRALRWIRAIAHPVPAFLLWSANLLLWHVAPLHEAALQSEAIHALQHALFVALGVNVWMPLFGPLPQPRWFGNLAKVGYIVVVRLVGTALANVLLWAGHPLYDGYTVADRAADQTEAASLMMVEGSILTLLCFAWLFLRAAREGEEKQALVELGADEARAARAVAAGRGDELRERLVGQASVSGSSGAGTTLDP